MSQGTRLPIARPWGALIAPVGPVRLLAEKHACTRATIEGQLHCWSIWARRVLDNPNVAPFEVLARQTVFFDAQVAMETNQPRSDGTMQLASGAPQDKLESRANSLKF